jgi:hypothetical protein
VQAMLATKLRLSPQTGSIRKRWPDNTPISIRTGLLRGRGDDLA